MNNKVFKNKTAWITGASSGIGEALACRLSEAGARVILSSNEHEELSRVQKKCLENNNNAHVLELDLFKSDELPEKAEEVLDKFGKVDFLFNNGGISFRGMAMETDLEIDRRVMEIDYFGNIQLTKALLPSMTAEKSGHIIVTTSVMGKMGTPLRSAYCAAKHALHGFYDSLRAEVWKNNIFVTIICPAAVQTQISKKALTKDGAEYGKMDKVVAAGITPLQSADQILKATASKKEEAVIGGGIGKMGVLAKRFFPQVYSKLVRRMDVV